ncbi:MAG: hypothetical protein SFT94_08770 [Pseudanabaenaceae cyanobacterium bins.68]|nr:hypothetical protein [Pseudanabaenaceae cyanobacterium bins.68]
MWISVSQISRLLTVVLLASACRPFLTTDSLPANPPHPLSSSPLSKLAPPYRQGKITLSPPRGWQINRLPSLKYAIFKQDTLTSISLLEVKTPNNLEQFMQTNVQSLAIAFPGWRQLAQQTFQTNQGENGKLVAGESQQLNQALYQRYYFWVSPHDPQVKLVLICSGRATAAQELQQLCDASAQTLEIQR